MTRRIVKALVATVSLAALVLGTDPSMARGHGGGGGGRGGGGRAVTSVAATLVVVTSVVAVVAEDVLVLRISAAPAWAGPLTSWP